MPTEQYNPLQLPPAPHDAVEDLTDYPQTVFLPDGSFGKLIGYRDAREYMEELRSSANGFQALRVGPPPDWPKPTRDYTHGGRVEYDPHMTPPMNDAFEYLKSQGYWADPSRPTSTPPHNRTPGICGYCFHMGRKNRTCENCGRLIR